MSVWLDLQFLLFMGSALLAVFAIAIFVGVKAVTIPHPIIKRHKKEKSFLNPNTNLTEDFPSLDDEPTIDLSVIVPAFDEEKRLPAMLDECLDYLQRKNAADWMSWEVIVVSDGSRDKTVEVAQRYSKKYTSDRVRVLDLIENRGKGGAVRLGMKSARGRHLLFADADGATHFDDHTKLDVALKKLGVTWMQPAIIIGSRAHMEEEAIATRSFFRTILMHGFHTLVWLFAVRAIRDTQCGFKLFTREAARTVFDIMHVERWAFDVEVLFIAQHYKIPISEIAVKWTEIDGSKVTPFWSWIQMGRDLFLIWFRYTIGAWSLQKEKDEKAK